MAATDYIREGTAENFPGLVLQNSGKGLVVVDFWAPWVGPSLRQQAMLTEVVEALPGRFLLVTVNTDEQKSVAAAYGVKSLPACKLFRHGRVVEELHGVQPHGDYRRIIEKHLGSADPVRQQALAAWRAGDHDQAVRLLAEAAMADPADPSLPELLAKLLIQGGRHADALEVLRALPPELRAHEGLRRLRSHLELVVAGLTAPPVDELAGRVEAEPGDAAACFQRAAARLLADDPEGAVADLLEAVRRDPGWRDGLAREALLAVFDTLGVGSDLVRRGRAALAGLAETAP
jgi:putative thioredoxin